MANSVIQKYPAVVGQTPMLVANVPIAMPPNRSLNTDVPHAWAAPTVWAAG